MRSATSNLPWGLWCTNHESVMGRKASSRLVVLVLALLFSAWPNAACIAVDSDNDAGTPPVQIELSIVITGQESPDQARTKQHTSLPFKNLATTSLTDFVPTGNTEWNDLAVHFSVPLRC